MTAQPEPEKTIRLSEIVAELARTGQIDELVLHTPSALIRPHLNERIALEMRRYDRMGYKIVMDIS